LSTIRRGQRQRPQPRRRRLLVLRDGGQGGVFDPVSVVDVPYHRSPAFWLRVAVLPLIVTALIGVLGLRLWSLQVIGWRGFAAEASVQAHRHTTLPAPRGEILDNRGRPLVTSSPRLTAVADTELLGRRDAAGHWWPSVHGRTVLRRFAALTGAKYTLLLKRIRRDLIQSPYGSAVILPRIARSLGYYLDERSARFPGIHVETVAVRGYARGAFGSEFLGLLGQISPAELKAPFYRGYRPGQVIGQSGVEATYERLLAGRLGRESVPVDALGRPVGQTRVTDVPKPGRSLELTIDPRIQRAAEQAILDGIRFGHAAGHPDANAGAAVVMNPKDGSIYAIASYPRFDQARAAHRPGYYQRLASPSNAERPLVDRATQGLYPAGSTFKPIVAEAALASGLITPATSLACTGSLTVGNIVFHNVEPGIFAYMNLPTALAVSCDTWFYRLGTMFYARQQQGHLDIQNWAHRLGLGRGTGFDVPGEAAGVVPTPTWLKRTFKDPAQRVWYEGYSVNLSIGQGYLGITPLQLAVAYATLANGGTVVRPHVGKAVLDGDGNVVRALPFKPRRRVQLTGVDAIRTGLYEAAHSSSGTSAAIFGNFPVPVAGKTGTAQVPNGSDNSWYASWAPAFDPKVVVVVLIEHGGFGAEAAAPAAREIYSAFFHRGPTQHP